ncbi:glycosyltransferase family 2 protein [Lactarius pseudohatsudake]|nr:glycosyltransferase family 2 protein [Lactarius pseudohatsudake]
MYNRPSNRPSTTRSSMMTQIMNAPPDGGANNNIYYGRIPLRVPRCNKALKHVGLFHGNFVIDSTVPTKLLNLCAYKDERDSMLRQVHYDPPHRIALFIVVTMYNLNEDDTLFARTVHDVMKNITYLCKRDRRMAARRSISVHIYEYTTQIAVTEPNKIEIAEMGIVLVQIVFCVKEKNQKKINSHRWFFNAFGPILQPNVCVLLDVGTRPGPCSIYNLWRKAFDINSNVSGACGEIVAFKGKYGQTLINPLDLSLLSPRSFLFELFFGRPKLRIQDIQHPGQALYFLGETLHGAGVDIFTANMYLAGDRILCWELVRGGEWVLHYVKSAYALTDIPDQVPELVSQRRRWLNGLCAQVLDTRRAHISDIQFFLDRPRNVFITFFVLTNTLEDPTIIGGKGIELFNTLLEYSYVGLLLTCFVLSLGNRPQGSNKGYTLAFVGFAIFTVYMTFAAIFLAVKGVQQVAAEKNLGATFSDLFTNAIFRDIVISNSATVGLYVLASIIHLDPWHMITPFFQLTLLPPSYFNILNVYASALFLTYRETKGDNEVSTDLGVVKATKEENAVEVAVPTAETDINVAYEDAIHVLSTKPPKEEKKEDAARKQEDYYHNFRTNVLLAWVLSNALLVAVILTTNGSAKTSGANSTVNGYLIFIMYSVALLAFVRFVGSTAYMIIRLFVGDQSRRFVLFSLQDGDEEADS